MIYVGRIFSHGGAITKVMKNLASPSYAHCTGTDKCAPLDKFMHELKMKKEEIERGSREVARSRPWTAPKAQLEAPNFFNGVECVDSEWRLL